MIWTKLFHNFPCSSIHMSRGSQTWVFRVIIEPFIFHLHDHRPGIWISVKFLAYIDFSNEEGLYWLVNRDTFWKMLRGSALLTCQARTWLKRRRTGASYCQGVVESMRLEGVPASLGFCTCQYYHPLNTWSTVLPSPPWILGRRCCVLPWILGPRDTLARIHQFLQLKRRGADGGMRTLAYLI